MSTNKKKASFQSTRSISKLYCKHTQTHTLNDLFDLQYDLQDDLGGQSHKSKMFLEILVKQFVTYPLFCGKAGTLLSNEHY